MLRSINRWLEANRWAGDAVIATGLLVVAVLVYLPSRDLYGFGMSVLLIGPLYARRSMPRTVVVAVAVLCLLQLTLIKEPVFGDVAAPLAVHAATAQVADRRWGIGSLIAGLIGSVLGALQWRAGWFTGGGEFLLMAGAAASTVLAAYLVGARQRDQRERVDEQVAALEERNRLLAVERDQRTEMVAAAERTRIARELHDIVAHSLSVVVVQADGGAAAIQASPDSAAQIGSQVLNTIAATSREALTEMRRMVAVLRAGGPAGTAADPFGNPDATYAPPPGSLDLPALIAQVAATGVSVTLQTRGIAMDLPPTTELTVYRVVQESLTNVIKHAGPAAVAGVTIDYLDGQLRVAIIDDGRGVTTGGDDGAGHGLVGMRERVLLQGGSLRVGPVVGGGFSVLAVLPLVGHPAAAATDWGR